MKTSKRKALALFLAAALFLTGVSQVSARSAKGTDNTAIAENTADTGSGSAVTGSGSSVTSPEPSDTPAPTDTPEPATPTTPGAGTTEPDDTTPTSPEPGETDTSVIYAKGTTFSSGKYTYKVTTAPTSTNSGAVKVIGLTATGKTAKTVTVPDSVTKKGYTYLVTAIGDRAFTTSTALTKITLKSNITFVGVRAFQKVSTLKTVVLGSNITIVKRRAFSGCSALRIVTIPSKVKTVGKKAFYNCKALNTIVVESKVITSIKAQAFGNVKKGSYIVIPSGKKASYKALLNGAGASALKLYTY